MTNLQEIISELEQQRAAIDNAIAALREVSGATEPKRRGRPPGSGTGQRKRGRPTGSGTGQRKRGRPPKKQVGLTDEGRQRLAASMKKRWALKRAAAKKAVKRKQSVKAA